MAAKQADLNLLKFASALRQQGVKISTSEVLDSLKALELVPLADQQAVKAALKATLLKDPANERQFERTFAAFFTPQNEREEIRQELQQAKNAQEEMIQETENELLFQGEPLNLSRGDKLLYSSLTAEQKDRVKDFLAKTSNGKNVEQNFKPLVQSLVEGHLNYWRRKLDDPQLELPEADTGDEEVDQLLEQIWMDKDPAEVLDMDMRNIADEDFPRVAAAIRKLSSKLATRISRRYRQSKKIDKLDLRRTIRQNIGYGGELFNLKYKAKKIQKPSLVLICDVSGSMARYAGFVLHFIYGLGSVVRRLESFVFAEELERITPYFLHSKSFEETMARVMGESSVWGEGTDLGRSLNTLLRKYPDLVRKDTVVVILSDTKTVKPQAVVDPLRTIRSQVREIIWLNPLDQRKWSEYQSVKLFSGYSAMFPCNTVADLERVLNSRLLV